MSRRGGRLAALVAWGLIGVGCGQPAEPTEEPTGEPGVVSLGLVRNTDPTDVVVWSQNMGMYQFSWKNAARCMNDIQCNTLGQLPDLIILQETTNAQATALRDELIRVSGVTNWGIYALDTVYPDITNYRSKAIIYNANRFTRTSSANNVKAWNVSDSNTCVQNNSYYQLVRMLTDDMRVKAGYAEQNLVVVSRHDDNFKNTTDRDTCDGPGAVNVFCSLQNSIDITQEVNRVGGGLQIMAGDWNYRPKTCTTSSGTTTTNWKKAYGCTTKYTSSGTGILTSGCGTLGNMGWRDPRLETEGLAVYDSAQPIDHVHLRDTKGFTLNGPSGLVDKHFYCGGVHPDANGDGRCDTMMTDHDARLLRVQY